jgi:hypothetical protein
MRSRAPADVIGEKAGACHHTTFRRYDSRRYANFVREALDRIAPDFAGISVTRGH